MIVVNKEYLAEHSKESRQSHLDLDEDCLERGGNSVNHRGVLAQYLNTTIPFGRICLCHACNNPKCSNPRHLYWGSDAENYDDALKIGATSNVYEKTIAKYGEGFYKDIAQKAGRASAEARKKKKILLTETHKQKISMKLSGRTLSPEHKKKISDAAKKRNMDH